MLTAMEVPGMPRGRIKKSSERATLKVPEAAKILGCGHQSVRELIAKGTIPHLRFGRNIVIPKHSFLQWLESAGASR
jgi:excisionase family DNA binding protein